MNTTGKLILGGVVLFAGIKMFGKKKENTSTEVIDTNTNASLEGKWVVKDNGHHFIILNGKRWFTGNVQAIVDFQKQYPGNDQPLTGLTEEQLSVYPISGGIFENLQLVPTGKTPQLETTEVASDVLKRLGAPDGQLCVRQNADGSSSYYSSQGGNRPCPYGGRIAVKAVTLQPARGLLGNPMFTGI